ncbi:hypothetical protein [Pseudomonas sp. RW3S2]|nr:hypothetical protein [Pseudomonas sp. RW3S2]MBC3419259.1 hypothetical protein [Pseudomonas sp. RW3S2]
MDDVSGKFFIIAGMYWLWQWVVVEYKKKYDGEADHQYQLLGWLHAGT